MIHNDFLKEVKWSVYSIRFLNCRSIGNWVGEGEAEFNDIWRSSVSIKR